MRRLYELLLQLHPPVFRKQFAEDMLWIFDETVTSDSLLLLRLDCFASLLRQWLKRCEAWKLLAAVVGACLQLTAGGVIWIALRHDSCSYKAIPERDATNLAGLMRLITCASCVIVLMVSAASLWMRSFMRQRHVNAGVRR